MSGVVMNNISARMDLNIAVESLKLQGIPVELENVSQSFLRVDSLLRQDTNNYEFPVLVNTQNAGTTVSKTSKQLKLQDAFYVTHVGYYIQNRLNPGTPGNLYSAVPFTYPSEALNRTGVVLSKLGYKLWEGQMSITVNGKVLVPGWDLQRHLYVPETQVAAVSGPFPNSLFYNDHDEFDGATDSFYPMEPNIVFIGNKGITVNINFPENISNAIGGEGYETYMVLVFRGLLIQNVSKNA